jgi:hypothetical protein
MRPKNRARKLLGPWIHSANRPTAPSPLKKLLWFPQRHQTWTNLYPNGLHLSFGNSKSTRSTFLEMKDLMLWSGSRWFAQIAKWSKIDDYLNGWKLTFRCLLNRSWLLFFPHLAVSSVYPWVGSELFNGEIRRQSHLYLTLPYIISLSLYRRQSDTSLISPLSTSSASSRGRTPKHTLPRSRWNYESIPPSLRSNPTFSSSHHISLTMESNADNHPKSALIPIYTFALSYGILHSLVTVWAFKESTAVGTARSCKAAFYCLSIISIVISLAATIASTITYPTTAR